MTKVAVIQAPGAAPRRIGLTERADGTLWVSSRQPLLAIRHLPSYTELAPKYKAALSAGTIGQIVDPAHIARIGTTPGGTTIEWAETYDARMREHHAAHAAAERRQIKVMISSRGWGDYSPITWTGPVDTPTADIVAEALARQERATDVDTPRTAEEIADLAEAAKTEWRSYIAEEIADLQDWLAQHPRASLPDAAGARRQWRNYNNLHNEGGDGYVPHYPCREEWDEKKNELDALANLCDA